MAGAAGVMRLVCACALLLALGACGKVGAPSQPGPADQITFPKTYPTH